MISKKVIVTVFVIGSILAVSSEANATTYHYYDGAQYNWSPLDSGTVTSISADILTPPTYPSVYSPSGSSAWPLITSGGNAYVQVGWTKDLGNGYPTLDGVHYFYEINYGTGTDYQIYDTSGPSQNTTHTYRVFLQNGNWVGTVDGVQKGSNSATGLTGYGIQFAEEINGDPATNAAFAGTSSGHARFSNLRAYYNNTTYYSPSLSWRTDTHAMMDHSSYVVGSSSISSSIQMWDDRY